MRWTSTPPLNKPGTSMDQSWLLRSCTSFVDIRSALRFPHRNAFQSQTDQLFMVDFRAKKAWMCVALRTNHRKRSALAWVRSCHVACRSSLPESGSEPEYPLRSLMVFAKTARGCAKCIGVELLAGFCFVAGGERAGTHDQCLSTSRSTAAHSHLVG